MFAAPSFQSNEPCGSGSRAVPDISLNAGWMSTEGSTRESATVKLDSGTATTISTHTSTVKTAEIVDVVTAASGSHKLVIKVLGTAGHPRVDIDAFVILTP